MKRIRKAKKRKAESSRTEPPQFDPGNYPPGELPKYSQKEIRTITLKPQISESDVEV
jgi:hypothetical protein